MATRPAARPAPAARTALRSGQRARRAGRARWAQAPEAPRGHLPEAPRERLRKEVRDAAQERLAVRAVEEPAQDVAIKRATATQVRPILTADLEATVASIAPRPIRRATRARAPSVLNEKFVAHWGSRQAAKDAKIRAKEEMRGPLRRVNEATDAGVHAKAGPRWRWTSIVASTTMAPNWSARTPGSCTPRPWRVSWRPWRLGGSHLPSAPSRRSLRQAAQPFRRCTSEPRVTAMSHELLVRHTSRNHHR